jgi:hypothetical protein
MTYFSRTGISYVLTSTLNAQLNELQNYTLAVILVRFEIVSTRAQSVSVSVLYFQTPEAFPNGITGNAQFGSRRITLECR